MSEYVCMSRSEWTLWMSYFCWYIAKSMIGTHIYCTQHRSVVSNLSQGPRDREMQCTPSRCHWWNVWCFTKQMNNASLGKFHKGVKSPRSNTEESLLVENHPLFQWVTRPPINLNVLLTTYPVHFPMIYICFSGQIPEMLQASRNPATFQQVLFNFAKP